MATTSGKSAVSAMEFMKAAMEGSMGSPAMSPGASSGAPMPTQDSGRMQGQKTPPSAKSKDGFKGKSKGHGGNTKKVTSNSSKKAGPTVKKPSMAAVETRLSNKSAGVPKSKGSRSGILSKFEGFKKK